jgi:hypothetical protein
VNAAGAWANNVLTMFASAANAQASVQSVRELPVRARKRCIFNVHCPGSDKNIIVPGCETPLTIDPSGLISDFDGVH